MVGPERELLSREVDEVAPVLEAPQVLHAHELGLQHAELAPRHVHGAGGQEDVVEAAGHGLDGVLDVPGRLEVHVQAVVVLGPVDGTQQVKHLRGS